MARNFVKTTLKTIYPYTLQYGLYMCHQFEERSFFIGVRQFPVCARCTGIYVGLLIGSIVSFIYLPHISVCLTFIAIMIVDGSVQLKTQYESTNIRRFVTGLFFGYALAAIAIIGIQALYS